MSTLRRHIPELALEWAETSPDRLWRRLEGTLCFADISGFTALAERLAQRGRMGGEELIETLGRVFSQMLDIAHARGGSLLKFGGDALLLFFPARSGIGDHAVQAASAAIEMRQALREAAQMPTSVGPLRLSMSVGLHSGDVDFFLVGGPHRELILLGPAADRVVETENTANAREIVVSAETAALLPKGATKPRDDGELLLRWRKAPMRPLHADTVPDSDHRLVRTLFPGELGEHLAPGAPDPEHRVACIAFLRFSGTDALLANDGSEALAKALQATVAGVQEILVDEGVTLLAVDLDRDGGKFFLASGVPHSHEDDEGVMLRALRRAIDANLPLSLQAGVNRGHVFAAEVGTPRRAAFSAMGDTTNTAARIAAKTPVGSIYAHPDVLDECLTLFDVEPAGPLTMKGKKEPQVVYAVGAALGLREREGLDVEEFVGRAGELERLREAVAALCQGHGDVIDLVGETGLGKTRLLAEATAGLSAAQLLALRGEPYGANSPYRMWRDPLRSLLGIDRDTTATSEALTHSVRRHAPDLVPWLPLIGNVAHVETSTTPEVEAIEPRFRPDKTGEVIATLLEAVHPGPLAIVVDDSHWCDAASANLLTYLERACRARPWLMLVARRQAEAGYAPESATEIAIAPMPPDDIRRLVDIATEAAPLRPQLVNAIVERAGGFPLFATELLRAAREAGSLEALPESLEAALAAQVDALDPVARRIVRYGSVLGRSFSVEVLAELLESEGHALDPDVLLRLDEFLIAEADGSRQRFRNSLLRDTIYEGLSFRLRTRLHRAAGTTLEKRAGDGGRSADALALHFYHGRDYERAWRYACDAARSARDDCATMEAIRNYELALDAARRVRELRDTELAEVWSALGETREIAGEMEAAVADQGRALRLAGDDPVRRAELLARRAWAREGLGALSLALRDLTTGRKLIAGDRSVAARRMLARLESLRAAVLDELERPSEALRTATHAAELARQVDEPESLVRALNVLHTATFVLHGARGDGEYLKEALPVAERLNRRGLAAMLRANLGQFKGTIGDCDAAVDELRAAREMYFQVGNFIEGALCGVTIGEFRVNQGRWDEAETELAEAIRLLKGSSYPEGVAFAEIEMARLALGRGNLAAAIEHAERTAEDFASRGQALYALQARVVETLARTASGAAAVALTLLDDAVAGVGGEPGFLTPHIAHARASALAALGRIEEARSALAEGLAAARSQNMIYEEGRLLALRSELAR